MPENNWIRRGKTRAKYGIAPLERLSKDLTKKICKGFSVDNLKNMCLLYLVYPQDRIFETLSRKLIGQSNLDKDSAGVEYALDGLPNKIMASELFL